MENAGPVITKTPSSSKRGSYAEEKQLGRNLRGARVLINYNLMRRGVWPPGRAVSRTTGRSGWAAGVRRFGAPGAALPRSIVGADSRHKCGAFRRPD